MSEEAPEEEGSDDDPDFARGRATEYDTRVDAIWERLKKYDKSYLVRWAPVFRRESRYASDLIDAWNDLGYTMTGPDGLWRTKVPNEWLRCDKNPTQKACQALIAHEPIFKEWDVFQEKISRTEPRRGGSFLLAHVDDLEQHMDTYLMEAPTREAMMEPRFYKEQMRE